MFDAIKDIFGTYRHFCLGANLARMESVAALSTLFARFPAIRMACGFEELKWHESVAFLSLQSLPVLL